MMVVWVQGVRTSNSQQTHHHHARNVRAISLGVQLMFNIATTFSEVPTFCIVTVEAML